MNNYGLPAQTEFTGNVEEQQATSDHIAAQEVAAQQQAAALQAESEATAKGVAERNDPRQDDDGDGKPDVGFNLGDIGAELSAAVGGGVQDAASSVATLPERAADMFNGEMAAAGDDYRPDWDPFTDHDKDPIQTHTWWGGAIRGLVQFGGLALGTVVAAKGGAAIAGGLGLKALAGGLGWVAAGTSGTLGANVARGAVVGGIGDVISRDSQKDNALGVLKEHHAWLDNPLATQDTDHPAMKTFKNIVEGMGIGGVFDLALETIGYGVKSMKNGKTAKELIDARNTSVKDQTIERGKVEVKETTEARGYKNKPVMDVQQGNPTSNASPKDVQEQVVRIQKEWGAENGSTDSLVSARELKRMNDSAAELGDKHHIATRDELFSDPDIKNPVRAARENQKIGVKSVKEIQPEIQELSKEIFEGRNTTDISPAEFFKKLDENANTIKGEKAWTGQDVATASVVNTSLIKEVRDMAVAARELGEVLDIGDVDGPVDAIKEKLIYSLTNINKANKLISDDFRARQQANPVQAKKELLDDKANIKESLDTLIDNIRADTSDAGLKQLMEIFSMSDVNNFQDYRTFLLTKLKGGELKPGGPAQTGLLIKELQGVFTHSVLSGPKTPVRAIGGTGSMTYLKPLSQALGASMRGDFITARAALSEGNALIQSLPEAWKLFKKRLHSTWSGDVATTDTRFSQYTAENDATWELLGVEMHKPGASFGDKAAYDLASIARRMNSNNFLTASTKLMDAGDSAFNSLMVRAKLRGRATRAAIENGGVTPESMVKAQQNFLDEITNADGTMNLDKIKVLDPEIFADAAEVKLTTELEGFSKSLQTTMESSPWTKPFFLFARTGVNGLAMAGKHTPGINLLLSKQRAIFTASADNLGPVVKYGIQNAEQLANAKALALGRQTMGASVIFMAAQMHMNGNLRGNGPADRQLRKTWEDAGYKRNTVKLGDTWVSFEAFEPFNQIITLVSDISDHSQLMGPEWTKDNLQKLVSITAEGITSKSYLSSLQDMVDVVSGDPKAGGRILGGLLNNTIPMSSMRNELGKLISPHTRELDSDIWTAIRNRNQLTENGGDQLAIKYDILNGRSIKDQDFPTRMFNMFSPIQFNLDGGPGRDLLFRSNYDLRTSVLSYNGISFAENAAIRSEFQRLIGKQNLEAKLDKLAKDPGIINSINNMEAGPKSADPSKMVHNRVIGKMFKDAKDKAWATLRTRPDVKVLIEETRKEKAREFNNNLKVKTQNANRAVELSQMSN
jgi:hypothetical protein